MSGAFTMRRARPEDAAAVRRELTAYLDYIGDALDAMRRQGATLIDPAYLPSLNQRHVDLTGHQPVVMARATAKLP